MQIYLVQLFADHHSNSSCSDDEDHRQSRSISSSTNSFEFPDIDHFTDEFNSIEKKFYDQELQINRQTISQLDTSTVDPITQHARFDTTYDLYLVATSGAKKLFSQDRDRDISSTFQLSSSSKKIRTKKSVSFASTTNTTTFIQDDDTDDGYVNLTSPKASPVSKNDNTPYSPKYIPNQSDDDDDNEQVEISVEVDDETAKLLEKEGGGYYSESNSSNTSGIHGSYIGSNQMSELKNSMSFQPHPSTVPYSASYTDGVGTAYSPSHPSDSSSVLYSPTSPAHSPNTEPYCPERNQVTYDDLMAPDKSNTSNLGYSLSSAQPRRQIYRSEYSRNNQKVSSNQINLNSVSNFLDSISSSSKNTHVQNQFPSIPIVNSNCLISQTNPSISFSNNIQNSNVVTTDDSQRGYNAGINRYRPYHQNNSQKSGRGGRRSHNNNRRRRRYNKKRDNSKRQPNKKYKNSDNNSKRQPNKKQKQIQPSTKSSDDFIDSLFD
jgi:hypothetical protein